MLFLFLLSCFFGFQIGHIKYPILEKTRVLRTPGPTRSSFPPLSLPVPFAPSWLQRLRHLADSSELRFWKDGAFRCLPSGAKQDRGASWGRDVKVWAWIRHRLDSHEALVRGLTSGCLLQRVCVCVCGSVYSHDLKLSLLTMNLIPSTPRDSRIFQNGRDRTGRINQSCQSLGKDSSLLLGFQGLMCTGLLRDAS